jgi:hypothetical protein
MRKSEFYVGSAEPLISGGADTAWYLVELRYVPE